MHFIGSQIKLPIQPRKDYTQSIKQSFQLREENPNNLFLRLWGNNFIALLLNLKYSLSVFFKVML